MMLHHETPHKALELAHLEGGEGEVEVEVEYGWQDPLGAIRHRTMKVIQQVQMLVPRRDEEASEVAEVVEDGPSTKQVYRDKQHHHSTTKEMLWK